MLFMTEFNDNQEMAEQKQLYLETIEDIQEKDQSYIQEKYEKRSVKNCRRDRCSMNEAKGWKTSRMGKVDFLILRLAVYELRYDEDVPGKVAINEAVELAKNSAAAKLRHLSMVYSENWQKKRMSNVYSVETGQQIY